MMIVELGSYHQYSEQAMGWTTKELQFDSMQGQEMSLFQSVQVCSEAPSASYLMDNWGTFLGGKVDRA